MKIAFNPSTVAALTTPPNNKDITFDLRGRNIFARGVKFCGTDTNTWRDIKINNVSIGSNILDLRNGSNTTLTNINGVVTINSTWRPVVDNLTSDSTTSSLSAKQGKVLKSLIDGKSNSGHTHDDRYLKLTGGTMASNALITFADSGSWGTDKGPQGARGGLYWTGQSDYAKLYAEETVGDNLDLVIQFGDDNSNGLSIRNKANTQTSYISAGGVITTGTFKGNLDWSYITNKPSSYTPSAHTHAWNSLTHSSTTENQAILTNGKANGWKLYTLNISRWDNAANNAHSHANKSVLDGITSALVNNWNVAYTFVNTITGTDTDKVINKWDEIVNFLAGITEDNKLNTLLNNKLSVYKLADNTNVGAIKNNGIYYSTSDASSGTLVNSPFNNGFTLINMTSLDNGDDLRRSRLAFNAYGEIKVSNDRDQANTAETWYNVLTSKNSGISGSTIKLNGTSITVYSSSTADGRYVKKSGDTMRGALNFANYTWNKVGDDVYMGDHNVRGQLCIMGVNGTTGLSFHKYGDASIRKSITFDGNTLYMNGSCDYAALSNQTNLLAINTVPNKTAATSIGSWSPISGRYVFHQKWTDTSTGGDSANFGIYLDGNLTANMVLDGYYNSLLGFRVIGATGGFLKANGTIDNSTYLTSHQSLSNYYTKSEVDTKLNSKLNYRLFWERTNIDLNSITEAWHTYEVNNGTDTANTPTNASWHQAVQWGTGDTDYAVQLCTAYTSNYSLYLRHKIAGKWNNWIQLATTTDIPSSLKNPHALTISLNGTSQGPYDGSAAKSINITPSSIGAATSEHNHDNRYLKLTGGTMQLGEGLKFHADDNYFGTNSDARIISLLDGNDKVCDGGLIIDERATLDGKEYVTELLRIRDSEFKWKGSNILHSGNSNINGNTITINGSSLTVSKSDHTHSIYAVNENYRGFKKAGRLPISGFYQSCESESGGNAPWSGWMHLINCQHNNTGNNYALQIAASFSDNNTFKIRVTQNNVNNAWRDIIHSGNIGNQTVANAYHLRINSANTWSTWYWEGQSGQPSWLWGSNDGTNMYVWNPSNFRVAYASSAGNADTVDGYHASSLWRSNGGIWNPNANISLTASGNNQEWSFDIGRNGYTGCYWHVWDSALSTLLKVNADNGKVYAPYNFVGNLEGNASTASKLQTPRTIWGQRFDGTNNVNGTLTMLSTFTSSGIYPSNNYICLKVTNGSSEWEAAKIGTYIAANNGDIGGYPAGLAFYTKPADGSASSSAELRMVIDANGKVGIGTTSPIEKLDVVGNIRATGNSYATHFYESSDKTLKKNIKSILSSANIPKIREFDWKDTGEHSYGFIAQELEEQGYGCLVNEANGKKTVNYTATLALTVAKLQNLINIQNKKISNLTKELKALKYGRKKNS